MTLGLVDIVLLLPLIFGFVRGLFRGLIKEVASIVGLFGGLIVSFYFSEGIYQRLAKYVDNPGIELRALCYIIVFVLVIIAINLISKTLTRAMDMVALGSINHVLGGLFGLGKWLLIVLVLIYFVNIMQQDAPFIQQETLDNSTTYNILLGYSEYLSDYIDMALGVAAEGNQEGPQSTQDTLNVNPESL